MRVTKIRFHTRWIPSDMMSFITSYFGATLSNTARTMGFFCAAGTRLKPKSASGSPGLDGAALCRFVTVYV